MTRYPDELTLERARELYFERNGFGPNGGYSDAWVEYKFGPLPFPFPNSPARVRAVRYHDLHHVLTGYETTLIGEMEIGAWEVASGCFAFPAAWHLNVSALGMGLVVAPLRVLRAYARGRRSKNLYGRRFGQELLARHVGEARAELGLDRHTGDELEAGDVLRFVPLSLFALGVALSTFLLAAPLALGAWPWLVQGRRRATEST